MKITLKRISGYRHFEVINSRNGRVITWLCPTDAEVGLNLPRCTLRAKVEVIRKPAKGFVKCIFLSRRAVIFSRFIVIRGRRHFITRGQAELLRSARVFSDYGTPVYVRVVSARSY